MEDLWQLITEIDGKYLLRAFILCSFPLCVAALVVMIEFLQENDLRKKLDEREKDK